ncbi:MAG: ABC transporter permease [Acidobacteriota bacterium]
MRWGLIFKLFLKSSQIQRRRAMLTVAAIAWGTISIMLLLAFGQGLKLQLNKGRRGMGESIAVLWPRTTSKAWRGLPVNRRIHFRYQDLNYLRQRLEGIEGMSGEFVNDATYTYGTKTVTKNLIGANASYGNLRNHFPQPGGRFFNITDVRQDRRVLFLGNDLAKTLFGLANPVGKTVLLDQVPYLVIGVMKPKLQMGMYYGPDSDHGVIPITTYHAQFGGDELNDIVLKAQTPEMLPEVIREARQVLGVRYNFDPTDERAVRVWNTVESATVLQDMTVGIQIFLGIIGALTLLIGGVGVANIMYAVVKERTREIGVKMAMGAHASDITMPLVLEGLVYTLLGGAIGMFVSMLIVTALGFIPTHGNRALQFLGKPTLSWPIGLVTIMILGVIGIAAGYFPGRRAAAIDPAETLRYE